MISLFCRFSDTCYLISDFLSMPEHSGSFYGNLIMARCCKNVIRSHTDTHGQGPKLSQSFLTHHCYCLHCLHFLTLIPSFRLLSVLQAACCHSLYTTEQHCFPAEPRSVEQHSFHSCVTEGVTIEAPGW